jgi:hypothetical protein
MVIFHSYVGLPEGMFDASEASPGFGPWPWHEAPEAPEAAEVVEAEGDASDARRGDTQDMPTDDIYIYYIHIYIDIL